MSRCVLIFFNGAPFSYRNRTPHLYQGFTHGRLAGRFKPPLAGRCNDFAPSRKKNATAKKQPSRPGPRKKKKHRPVPSRRKKKKLPRPASEKKRKRPVPPRKKKTPRLASKKTPPAPSRHEQQNTPPRGWKLETNTTACLFFSLSCCTFISYSNSKIHRPEGGNWKQIPPPVSFSLFLVVHLYRIFFSF